MRQLPDDRALILAATHFEHEKKRALAEQLLSCTQKRQFVPKLELR